MKHTTSIILSIIASFCALQSGFAAPISRPTNDICAADTLFQDSALNEAPEDYMADVVRKKSGILVIGGGATIRGCNPYGYTREKLENYANLVNEYQDIFPEVQVYFQAIPTAVEFYIPESSRHLVASQRNSINILFGALNEKVKKVDSYDALLAHVDEPIYSRTDHHWAPRGAFYAAEQLAKVAEVPFKQLDAYTPHTVHDYVGTMYTFTKLPEFKAAPEDFIYYTPAETSIKTTLVHYSLDKTRKRVISETEPAEENFFRTYKDGSGAAYLTFMGGDTKLTKVETEVKNGRRVLLLKDSFGNALSSFLFYSFEEVHLIDCRYFTKNIIDYVHDNGITDIVFCNNIAHTSPETVNMYRRYLTQGRTETAPQQ